MSNISKSFVDVFKSFKNVMQHFAQTNRNFVIIIITGFGSLFYMITITSNKVVWVLALLNAFLCLINYSKNKNLTEATMTLIIGLFTIFTVTWNNEFILIFTIFVLFYVILSFMVSSVQIAKKIESIITVAAGYWQEKNDFKTKYNILHSIAEKPTRNQQTSIEERSLIVKEMIFDNMPINKIPEAKEIIESFTTVLGFEINDAIINYRLINNIYIIQMGRYLELNDMELIFNFILMAPFGPKDYFEVLNSIKDILIKKKSNWGDVLSRINELSQKYRDKDIVVKSIQENLA